MQKGFAQVYILAGLIILALVAGGAYYFGKQSTTSSQNQNPQTTYVKPTSLPNNTPTPLPSSSPDVTANWKTYNDGTYRFRYPNDWIVQGGYDEYFKGQTLTIKNPAQTVVVGIYPKQPPYGFEGPQPQTTAQDITVTIDGQTYVGREITFANIKAYADLKVPGVEKYHILFGTGYPAGADNNASLADYKATKQLILQILSTFKFTQ